MVAGMGMAVPFAEFSGKGFERGVGVELLEVCLFEVRFVCFRWVGNCERRRTVRPVVLIIKTDILYEVVCHRINMFCI